MEITKNLLIFICISLFFAAAYAFFYSLKPTSRDLVGLQVVEVEVYFFEFTNSNPPKYGRLVTNDFDGTKSWPYVYLSVGENADLHGRKVFLGPIGFTDRGYSTAAWLGQLTRGDRLLVETIMPASKSLRRISPIFAVSVDGEMVYENLPAKAHFENLALQN